jgi:hypothetical protein
VGASVDEEKRGKSAQETRAHSDDRKGTRVARFDCRCVQARAKLQKLAGRGAKTILRRFRTLSLFIITTLALASTAALATREARADEGSMHLALDWEKVAQAIQSGSIKSTSQPREAPRAVVGGAIVPNDPQKWVALAPHVSLVARDWGNAHHLAGGPMALTDEIRLSRSSRMVFTRVRLGNGRFAPFAHMGLGQWRVDTDLMPVYVRHTELATQLGGGFDLRMLRDWAIALEVDYTVLVREQREHASFPTPYLWGSFVVSRMTF